MKGKLTPLILGGIVGAILVIGAILFTVNNGVKNEGNKREASLNAQFMVNQNTLSDCIVKIRETAGVASAKADKLDEILTEAVKGRYIDGSSAEVGRGQLFSAIQEAYPDLQPVGNLYDRVYDTIIGCRTDYKGSQDKLVSMLNSYDTWRTGSWTVRNFGGEYPSENLVARINRKASLKGKDAYEKMSQLVVVKDASEAYNSGEIEAEDPFGNNSGNG